MKRQNDHYPNERAENPEPASREEFVKESRRKRMRIGQRPPPMNPQNNNNNIVSRMWPVPDNSALDLSLINRSNEIQTAINSTMMETYLSKYEQILKSTVDTLKKSKEKENENQDINHHRSYRSRRHFYTAGGRIPHPSICPYYYDKENRERYGKRKRTQSSSNEDIYLQKYEKLLKKMKETLEAQKNLDQKKGKSQGHRGRAYKRYGKRKLDDSDSQILQPSPHTQTGARPVKKLLRFPGIQFPEMMEWD